MTQCLIQTAVSGRLTWCDYALYWSTAPQLNALPSSQGLRIELISVSTYLQLKSFHRSGGVFSEKRAAASFSDSVTCKALGLPYLEIKNTQEKHRSHLLWLCKYLAYINVSPHCWFHCLPSKCYYVFSDLNSKILWRVEHFLLWTYRASNAMRPEPLCYQNTNNILNAAVGYMIYCCCSCSGWCRGHPV